MHLCGLHLDGISTNVLIFPIAGKGQERRWINHRARITSTLYAHDIKGKLFFKKYKEKML
jgi:hypothetical protein